MRIYESRALGLGLKRKEKRNGGKDCNGERGMGEKGCEGGVEENGRGKEKNGRMMGIASYIRECVNIVTWGGGKGANK